MRKLLVLLAAVAFVFAFTTPAAADVSFSGYIVMETYVQDVDNPAPAYDDSDTLWMRDEWCSRLTAKFNQGPVSGLVEIRPSNGSFLRHWWGTWNFGGGTLGIGRFWTPDFVAISSAVFDCGAIGGPGGDPGNSVRADQIQLQFGGLKIAAMTPQQEAIDGVGAPAADTDTRLPKIVAAYNLKLANVGLTFFGGYQSYDVVNATDKNYSVDSNVYGITGSVGVGPLTIKAFVEKAQNIQEYCSFPAPAGYRAYWDGTKVIDAEWMGYGVNLAFKASDMITITAGYNTGTSEQARTSTWEDETATYHVNATISLAKGVSITPEYGVIDMMDKSDSATTKAEEGKTTYYGAYWKIAF